MESVLPELPPDMCEGDRYIHLWDSKDAHFIEYNQVFWVLFQISVAETINYRPQLSPKVYEKYKNIIAFQVTMNNIQICNHKDKTWTSLPYMVVDEEFDNVIVLWPPAWKIGFKTSARGTTGTSTS